MAEQERREESLPPKVTTRVDIGPEEMLAPDRHNHWARNMNKRYAVVQIENRRPIQFSITGGCLRGTFGNYPRWFQTADTPRILEPVPKLSVGAVDSNLIIEGDCLQAMASLKSRYAGAVDVAYVDDVTGDAIYVISDVGIDLENPEDFKWVKEVIEAFMAQEGVEEKLEISLAKQGE